ncbi:MAG: 3D domain-containing protein [Patescibacteria group bacterium]|nr:3D domain-containing protein [Patescibacteria group bacterium]
MPGKSFYLKYSLIILFIIVIGLPLFESTQKIKVDLLENFEGLAKIEGNSLLPLADSSNPEPKITQKIIVIVTGYSSTADQTDSDPFITAAGTLVREGIIASNLLPFGTKVRIPEIYGDKVFIVEDRMSWEKGYYHIDIWFPTLWQAKEFGAKKTYIEILEG